MWVRHNRWMYRGATLKLSENPVIRVLAGIIAVAAGIRLIYWLLLPVLPYMLAAVAVFALFQLVRWCRGRW